VDSITLPEVYYFLYRHRSRRREKMDEGMQWTYYIMGGAWVPCVDFKTMTGAFACIDCRNLTVYALNMRTASILNPIDVRDKVQLQIRNHLPLCVLISAHTLMGWNNYLVDSKLILEPVSFSIEYASAIRMPHNDALWETLSLRPIRLTQAYLWPLTLVRIWKKLLDNR